MKMMDINYLSVCADHLMEARGKQLRVNREKSLQKANAVIKDLQLNRNWSWYREIEYRNRDNLDAVALFYRGNKITYKEMLGKMQEYAKSLKNMGIKKGDIVPACMSNSPEFIYLLGAVSMIGAQINIFSEHYDKEYLKEIINGCNKNVIFVEDNKYGELKDVIESCGVNRIVLQSLADSLPNGNNPFRDLDAGHLDLFESKVNRYKKYNTNIFDVKDFVKFGENYKGTIVDETVTLEDPFTITYSSGTTTNRPKGIVHAAKSFNGVTRFHDKEINHTPSYKHFSMQANIPPFSSTGLISGISDALTQGCRLALEPIYDENFVVESLIINKPSYLDFTKSYWLKFAKEILYNPKYANVKLPSLTICFSVGERTDLNEERLINMALKKVEAGKDLLPFPFQVVKLSTAGGDCEHGGIFYKLMRAYSNLNPLHMMQKIPAGLETFDAVDVAILDENKNHCRPYKVGNLVANSYFNMLGYHNNEEATKNFYLTDAEGRQYGDCTATAFMDFFGDIHFKGRTIPGVVSTSEIRDSILRNLSTILTCEVVEQDGYYVAHVEFLPEERNVMKNLLQVEKRIRKELGEDISSRIVYKLHSNKDSFKLTHSGKRDTSFLKAEGISNCIKPIYESGNFYFQDGLEYINGKMDKAKVLVK